VAVILPNQRLHIRRCIVSRNQKPKVGQIPASDGPSVHLATWERGRKRGRMGPRTGTGTGRSLAYFASEAPWPIAYYYPSPRPALFPRFHTVPTVPTVPYCAILCHTMPCHAHPQLRSTLRVPLCIRQSRSNSSLSPDRMRNTPLSVPSSLTRSLRLASLLTAPYSTILAQGRETTPGTPRLPLRATSHPHHPP
jgi:hypothetical protein